jgi:iron complex transport system permease protein
LLLGVAGFLSLLTGPANITPLELLKVLAGGGDEAYRAIIFEIRLPRLLLAIGVGAVLGMAGAALQGYLRNPLADAAVLGTSNAAALGAVAALYFGFSDGFPWALPAMAIGFAMLSLAFIFALARQQASSASLILAGLATGTLAGAGISLALNLSANPFAAAEITFWLLGSLQDRSMAHVLLSLPFILAACGMFFWMGQGLDALTLGEEAAQGLGVRLEWLLVLVVFGVALGVGAAVAVSGAIGFVGLVTPHLLRPFVGHRPSRLLLPSALAGALLLAVADGFVRLLPLATELRLGVVTAFLGVPFFIYLLLRRYRMF